MVGWAMGCGMATNLLQHWQPVGLRSGCMLLQQALLGTARCQHVLWQFQPHPPFIHPQLRGEQHAAGH